MRRKHARGLGIALAGAALAFGGVVVAGHANAGVAAIGDSWTVSNGAHPGHFCNGTERQGNPVLVEVNLVCLIRELGNNGGIEQATNYRATSSRNHRTRTVLEIIVPPGEGSAVLRLSPIA